MIIGLDNHDTHSIIVGTSYSNSPEGAFHPYGFFYNLARLVFWEHHLYIAGGG